MEFEAAAARLKSDHKTLRSKARNRTANRTLASSAATARARKAEEYRKKQLQLKKEKERFQKQKLESAHRYVDRVERHLGVISDFGGGSVLANNDSSDNNSATTGCAKGLELRANSVYGQGDKITLPSSVLGTLAEKDLLRESQERGQPLFFRLGIRKEGYVFPASPAMKKIMEETPAISISNNVINVDGGSLNKADEEEVDDSEVMEEEEEEEELSTNAYLDELTYKYISYTHGTVVEFTEDEGYIGLPASIASALLDPQRLASQNCDNNHDTRGRICIETRRTVDPASISVTQQHAEDMDQSNNRDTENAMAVDTDSKLNHNPEENALTLEEKTPGHPAYGQFLVPAPLIEVTLLTRLPLGTGCTLAPTRDAIHNGFYNLKNIKLVLEQSLVRTRACLNVGDVVHSWFRGKKYDLTVKDVTPSMFGVVSCVNTDVVVDIAAADDGSNNINAIDENSRQDSVVGNVDRGQTAGFTTKEGRGYRLSGSTTNNASSQALPTSNVSASRDKEKENSHFTNINVSLPSEPPLDQKENVITIQIRGMFDGASASSQRRRFDAKTSLVKDLFAFTISANVTPEKGEHVMFRLVTRFPRRVLDLEVDGRKSLSDIGLASQEILMVEPI